MCGIQVVIARGLPRSLLKILEAGKSLHSRGPDSSCTKTTEDGIYTFHRLAINDTSESGNQPFIATKKNGCKIYMLCNGEIYNHVQLAEKYSLKCESKSDCEVILRLYEKLGSFPKVVQELDGVFAIVLVDDDKCWFARDRIGVRPLFQGWMPTYPELVGFEEHCLA